MLSFNNWEIGSLVLLLVSFGFWAVRGMLTEQSDFDDSSSQLPMGFGLDGLVRYVVRVGMFVVDDVFTSETSLLLAVLSAILLTAGQISGTLFQMVSVVLIGISALSLILAYAPGIDNWTSSTKRTVEGNAFTRLALLVADAFNMVLTNSAAAFVTAFALTKFFFDLQPLQIGAVALASGVAVYVAPRLALVSQSRIASVEVAAVVMVIAVSALMSVGFDVSTLTA